MTKNLVYKGLNAALILPILMLILGLVLLKKWFPSLFNFLKRLSVVEFQRHRQMALEKSGETRRCKSPPSTNEVEALIYVYGLAIFNIKTKRKIIAFIYHSGVLSISLIGIKAGTAFNSPELLNISAIVLLAHLLTFRIIPILRWIQEKLIRETTCYGCGALIELYGLYPLRMWLHFTQGKACL